MTKQTTALATPQNLKTALQARRDDLQGYLGEGVDVDHYIGGILNEFQKNPALFTCEASTVLDAVRKAATVGLPLGQDLCYLVPYSKKCQFQMGYKGLLNLARRQGAILRHVVRSIHMGDEDFAYEDGLKPWVQQPRVRGADRTYETMTYVYAHFALANNQEHLEVMTRVEVEQHRRQYAKATGKDSPWQTNPLAMAKKTVIRRAFAGDQIPISSDLRRIVFSDEFNEVVDGSVVSSGTGDNEDARAYIEDVGMDEAGVKPSPGQRELQLKGDLDA